MVYVALLANIRHSRISLEQAHVKRLPVPKLTASGQIPFIQLVDLILFSKETDPATDTSDLEREIDRLVYNLYGLTEEEIAAVERGTI